MRLVTTIVLLVLCPCSSGCEGESADDDIESETPDEVAVMHGGLYQTTETFGEAPYSYRYFLRFYPDSTVIGVSSTGTATEIGGWFTREDETLASGTYSIDGDEITFTLQHPDSNVDYDGVVEERGRVLQLVSYSHTTGHGDSREYVFVEMD